MITRALAASLAVLFLAHAATAQLTDKQAVAQVKAATKSELKTFKQAGADALKTLNTDLGEFDGMLTDSITTGVVIGNLQNRVLPFVVAVNTAFADAVKNVDGATSDALVALANGGSLAGVYPDDLYYGTGGALDDFRAALNKAAAKLHDSAAKRLAKTVTLAEKISNIAIVAELRLPSLEQAEAVDQASVTFMGETARLDLVLTVSSLGTANDGLFFFAGSTADLSDTVDVGYFNQDGIASVGAFLPDSDGRFAGSLASGHEGGDIAFVKQKAVLTSTIAIGVR